MTGTGGSPSWARLILTAVVTAICTGAVVAAVCVWAFTPRPAAQRPASTDDELPPPRGGSRALTPPPSSGFASDEGQGSALDSISPLPLTEAAPSESREGRFLHGAVSVDSKPCANVGRDILARKGSAVDAAIAALFCNGVSNPHSMGLGGGFLMTIYLANGTSISLVARETAPMAASREMFSKGRSSKYGPGASGVPGELLGYWEAKKRFGNPDIKWADLVQPAIDLCQKGIAISSALASALHRSEESIRKDPGLREIFIDPDTDKILVEGESYKDPVLAETLRRFSERGASELYTRENGTGAMLVADMASAGGLVTLEDLARYRTSWEQPVRADLPNTEFSLLSSPPPGSGAILAGILGLVGGYKPTPADRRSPLGWHRFLEACKFAYARRTLMGDWKHAESEGLEDEVSELVTNLTSSTWLDSTRGKISDTQTVNNASFYGAEFFNVEDAGTAHISVLSPAGDAVAVTSTVNLYFGSKFRSPSTGIIMNNQMDDFAYPDLINAFGVPPSENNMVAPGKRPVSSMSPSVVVNRAGRVVAVVGASGGTKITTAVAQVLYRVLFLGQGIKEAVDARRLHHQLYPNQVLYESGTTRWLVEGLQAFGHETKLFPIGGSIVQALMVEPETGDIAANADFRKGGGVAGF